MFIHIEVDHEKKSVNVSYRPDLVLDAKQLFQYTEVTEDSDPMELTLRVTYKEVTVTEARLG